MIKQKDFPSPNLGLSLKQCNRIVLRDVASFRPLIWGYL